MIDYRGALVAAKRVEDLFRRADELLKQRRARLTIIENSRIVD